MSPTAMGAEAGWGKAGRMLWLWSWRGHRPPMACSSSLYLRGSFEAPMLNNTPGRIWSSCSLEHSSHMGLQSAATLASFPCARGSAPSAFKVAGRLEEEQSMTLPLLLSSDKAQSWPQHSCVQTSVNWEELRISLTAHRWCKTASMWGTQLSPSIRPWPGGGRSPWLLLGCSQECPCTGLMVPTQRHLETGLRLMTELQFAASCSPGSGVPTISPRLACRTWKAHLAEWYHAYLRDFCKLSIGLTALLCCFHGNSVVVHKGPVNTQLAGLQGERIRVWDRCEIGIRQV